MSKVKLPKEQRKSNLFCIRFSEVELTAIRMHVNQKAKNKPISSVLRDIILKATNYPTAKKTALKQP